MPSTEPSRLSGAPRTDRCSPRQDLELGLIRDRADHHTAVAFDPGMRFDGDVGQVAAITKANTEAQFGSMVSASQHRICSQRLHEAGRGWNTYGDRSDCPAHRGDDARMCDGGARRRQLDEAIENS